MKLKMNDGRRKKTEGEEPRSAERGSARYLEARSQEEVREVFYFSWLVEIL
jgi:CelD/BcsL family acetyltransferase involved in cellulose biosynthesis